MSVYYYCFFVLTHTLLESLNFFVKLNQDTWSNEAVSQIIMSNFFFWQVCNFLIDLSVLIRDSLLIFHKFLQDVPSDMVSNLILFGYFFPRSPVTCLFFFFFQIKKKKKNSKKPCPGLLEIAFFGLEIAFFGWRPIFRFIELCVSVCGLRDHIGRWIQRL